MHEVKALGSGAPRFAAGDEVTVFYAPDNPDDFGCLWLPAVVAWGVAAPFGGCVWLSRRFPL